MMKYKRSHTMTDWETEEWTANAKRLLNWISSIDCERPAMLMVRHSHREKLKDHHDTMNAGLTELGKRLSREMGTLIPTDRNAHIFLSVVPRCYQTAEALMEGFTEQGGEVIDMDPLATLIGPEYSEREVWTNLNPNGENVTQFVNRWANDEFQGIESFEGYKTRLMADTVKRMLDIHDNQLHIHVTHDLALMCTKRILLNRPLTYNDREPYLGGLGITIDDEIPILFVASTSDVIKLVDI
jgi:broad specificity phosphatase PhoE